MTVNEALQIAMREHQAGKLAQAEIGYRNILAQNPDHPDALHLLGVLAGQTGHIDDGIEWIIKALRVHPEFPDAYGNLGRLLAEKGKFPEAVLAYQKLVSLKPKDPQAFNSLGIVLNMQGRLDEAAAAYAQAIHLKPKFAEPHHDLGAIFRKRGLLDLAIREYSKALQLKHDYPEAYFHMGDALLAQGKHRQAAAAFSSAVDFRPNWAEAHLALSVALCRSGRIDEGYASNRRALELKPDYPEAHENLGQILRQRGQIPQAMAEYTEAIRLKPSWGVPHFDIGMIHRDANQFPEALAALDQALAANPDYFEAHAHRAAVLGFLHEFDRAMQAHARAAAIQPNDPLTHETLGFILSSKGEAEVAVENFRKAIDIEPARATAWNGMGLALRSLGRFKEATEAFQKVLAIDPGANIAYSNLASVGWEPGDRDEIARLKSELNAPKSSIENRYAIGFALGKVLDSNNRFDEAFEAYHTANNLFRQARASLGEIYHPEAQHAFVDRCIRKFTADYFAGSPRGDPSDLPVFIVGMPRSGTTLVEQIASTHSQVFGAGELKDIFNIAAEIGPTSEEGVLSDLAAESTKKFSEGHFNRLRGVGKSSSRVIDKLPSNIYRLGLIARLFPGARVIFCKRDALDTCLSCYFQWFTSGNLFSYNLADCGREYLESERLVAHWKSVLPLKMIDVQYETLVTNLESESRRLIDFFGLNWEPACLDFHKTERSVQTSSLWQVRQPLYASSVGRWRKYENHLGELVEVLEAEKQKTQSTESRSDEFLI